MLTQGKENNNNRKQQQQYDVATNNSTRQLKDHQLLDKIWKVAFDVTQKKDSDTKSHLQL